MTKTKAIQSDVKPTDVGSAPPQYTAVPLADYEQPKLPGTTCWYVLGILSTIFCCLPFGVIGMVHAMIAKHEGERGNLSAYRKRMHQARCWTCWAITLGLLALIFMILYAIAMTVGFSRVYAWCGTGFLGPYYRWNSTQWNNTFNNSAYDGPTWYIE